MLEQQPDYVTKEKRDIDDLAAIVKALRSPQGCPWDRKQTHASIERCMIEEAAESVDAIRLLAQKNNPDSLREELGDVLFQVMMHSVMAEEEGYFTFSDVVDDISRKMIRRHPHVFGCYETDENGNPIRDWNEIKQREKHKSTFSESKRHKRWRKKLVAIFCRLLSL